MKQRLVIIGSNTSVLERAKDLGFEIVLVQEKRKIKEKDILLSDTIFGIDYTNLALLTDTLVNFSKHFPITGILTFSENALIPTAYVAEKLGVALNSLETVELLKDKFKMRTYLAEKNFSSVNAKIVRSTKDIKEFIKEFNYPVILKPIDGSASENIYRLQNEEELNCFLKQNDITFKPMLIEEYLSGNEYSVEALTINGEHQILAITDKVVDQNFVELAHIVPAKVTSLKEKIIEDYVKEFLDVIELKFGPSHTELIFTQEGPKIVESHNRPGGGGIVHLVKLVYGIDVVKATLEYIKDKTYTINEKKFGGAAVRFLTPFPGEIISMADRLIDEENVHRSELYVKKGDIIKELKSSHDYLGYIMCTGNNPEQAMSNCKNYLNALDINIKDIKGEVKKWMI
ncbi:ATP-grasp domain-containing protein [Priestia megaterium]|uniref:ATP-grasp domain-containing protein n=1 Tax=Priestia megaterium TaxID=1404 RepID=UPI00207AEA3D|nr:ATP-grasp domain-containing protein [Priestia megaterium]USL45553.1 ATP-grasp domain-containing protein [Priestia megaterium]